MAKMAPLTLVEFHDWANRPEFDDRHYELDEGVPVEVPLQGERHGLVCGIATFWMTNYVRSRKGYVICNNCGLIVGRNPDSLVGPDLMVFLDDYVPSNNPWDYVSRVPPLVVEVVTSEDRTNRFARRIQQYSNFGVPLIWVIDAEDFTIARHKRGSPVEVLRGTDTLTGEGVLPEFTCSVAEIFRLPGTPEPLAS